MAVNVRGVWLGIKYVVPVMSQRGGGSIVITSSTAGIGGTPDMSAYTTSKHAVIGLMRTAALEGSPLGIRVNTVNPSPIETRMMRSIEEMRVATLDDSNVTVEQVKQAQALRIPLERYGNPEEVAQLMLFLACDDSSFCTGASTWWTEAGLLAAGSLFNRGRAGCSALALCRYCQTSEWLRFRFACSRSGRVHLVIPLLTWLEFLRPWL